MTSFNLQELIEIGKHLAKINEIHDQNEDSDEIRLAMPDKVELTSVSNGMPIGTIEWSDETEDFVFVPSEEKPEPVRNTSHIPLPPWTQS